MQHSRGRWVLGTIVWGFIAVLLHNQLRELSTDLPIQYVDAIGFALFVPAFVVLGAVMLPAFEFVRYRRHRGNRGFALDLVLVVAGGLAGGLLVGFLLTVVDLGPTITVTLVAIAVYAAAFGVFTARNLEYYDKYKSPLPG